MRPVTAAGSLVLAVLAVGSVGAATAANTVPGTRSGDGQATIGSYSATGLAYTLNATSPDHIDSVTMTLSAAPPTSATIRVQFRTNGPWYSCSAAGTTATCVTAGASPPTVMTTDNVRVVVAD